MKYIVILGDGMADYQMNELQGKTPLQAAHKPAMDDLAKYSRLGLVQTVPETMAPGSDTANLAVLGYDPQIYYSGRSPFEAVSMGVTLADTDVAFRCNLVTLSGDGAWYGDNIMLDHGADEITSAEAAVLMDTVNRFLRQEDISFYPGISYRHLMVWRNGNMDWKLTPPHDILGQRIGDYLPQGSNSQVALAMMQKSMALLTDHEVNRARVGRGQRPANSIWIWGEGKKPRLPLFHHRYGLRGAVISAVDLIKGLGQCAGLTSIDVPGATGNLDSDYRGEAEAALRAASDGFDFVYLHLEAPDEYGHRQETENKIKAIEMVDKVVAIIKEGLDRRGEDYKIMILPDHATPLSLRTHTRDPVPFLIYHKNKKLCCPRQRYDEIQAGNSGLLVEKGYTLMDLFLKGDGGEERHV